MKYDVFVQMQPIPTGKTAKFVTWVDGAFVEREMTNHYGHFMKVGEITVPLAPDHALNFAKTLYPEHGSRIAIQRAS